MKDALRKILTTAEKAHLILSSENKQNIKDALGSFVKKPTPSELKNRHIFRKSIVASRNIKKGEIFAENNLTTKRPAEGISPMKWNSVIGGRARGNFKRNEPIRL